MSPRFPLLLAALLLLLGVACGRGPGAEHDPRPQRVVPARGVTQRAVAVRIEGENFQPFAVRQLSGSEPVRREDGFQAFLGDTALEDVAWVDAQTLRARVPAGIAPGRYALTVQSPLGRRVQLPDAYVVAAGPFGQLEASAQVDRSELLVGQEAQVTLELRNPGDAAASGLEVELEVQGPGSAVALDAAPPAALAPGARLTRRWRVQGTGVGALALRFRVAGTDAESGLALEPAEPQLASLQVLTPAALIAQGALTLQQVSLGQELEASLTVLNEGGSAASGVSPALQTSGVGRVEVLQAPQPGDVPGGAAHTFRWRLRADAVGALDVAAQAHGTEALAGAELLTGPVYAGALRVQRPAALSGSLVTPGRVNVAQPFAVTFTVENTGEAVALGVRPEALVVLGSAGAQQLSAPTAQDVPGGERRTFTWSYRALAAGELRFVAQARGADANSGAPVDSGPVTDSAVEVQTPAALEATASVTPAQVSVGQLLLLELSVRNRGQADALAVQPSLPGFLPGGPLSVVSAPPADTVPGGGVRVFRWTLSALRPASVVLGASAQGTDANSGAAVDSGVASAPGVRVQAPATLQALLSAPAHVSVGQTFSVSLEVVHGGEASLLDVTPRLPVLSGAGAALLATPPVPASVDLSAGERHTFTWHYTATSTGPLRIESGASGTDLNSAALVTAPPPAPVDLTVQRPAALAAALELDPQTVNVGQLVTVSLTVQNTGEATASNVVPQAPVLEGTGSATLSAGPLPASATLTGGAAQVFTWQYSAAAAGALTVRTAAAGADANTRVAIASPAVTHALTIQRPAQLTAQLTATPGRVDEGQTLTLTLHVTNTGETAAQGIAPAEPLLTGSSGTQLLSPPVPAPVTLAGGASHDFTWSYRAGSAGGLGFSSSASGTDANSGATVTTGQLSTGTLDVQQPPVLVGSLLASPGTANEGQRIVLAFTVQNTGEATANAVTPLVFVGSADSSATLRASPTPASVALVGGASHTFTWEYDVGSAGSLLFTTRAEGKGANTGADVASGDVSAPVTVQLAAALVGTLSAPTRVSEGQLFTLTLQVQNTGQSAAEAVVPSAPTLSRAGGASLVSGPVPASVELAPGATQRFTWEYRAGSAGALTFGSSASGTDATSRLTLGTGPLTAAPLTVQRPAALVGTLVATPASASEGQTLTVTLTVQNTGQAFANAVTPGLLVSSGTGSAALLSAGPTPAGTNIPGGASRTFSWQYTATAAGTLSFSGNAQGTDANSGATVAAASASSAPLTLQRPAVLTATLSALQPVLNEAQPFSITLVVQNTGEATATAVTPAAPTLSGTSTATWVSGPTPASATLAGGRTQAFTWTYLAGAAGDLGFASSAAGLDANSGAALGSAQVATPSLTVLRPAQLSASLALPPEVSVGQEFSLVLTVHNAGSSAATEVAPAGLSVGGGAGLSLVSGPTPASASVPGGASEEFRWTWRATAPGTASLQAGASGKDATDGRSATAAAASATTTAQQPPALQVTLTSPDIVGLGETFTVKMTVQNGGAARADEVMPTAMQLVGSATAALVSGPTPTSALVQGGQARDFLWRYTATSEGAVEFSGSATGRDGNSGAVLTSDVARSTSTFIRRATEVASDPFGDGTSFAWVFNRDGKLLLGPNKSGSGAVSSNPDGSAPQSISFRLPRDVTGSNQSKNTSAAPYPSIGSAGCVENTPACGPNNEAGRGLFFQSSTGNQSWFGLIGAHPSYKITYLYLTSDTDEQLDFRYVDLDQQLPGTASGFTAAQFYGGILNLGVATSGGSRPGLLAISRMPGPQGLEGNDTDVVDLALTNFPYFGGRGTPGNPAALVMIDAMTEFQGKLYLANNGGCVRTTRLAPRPYKDFPGDWANCRPEVPAYTELTSLTVSQIGELEPADRAVPKLVPFGGRLYMARNTTAGPQLFACTPEATGLPDCDPGDWSLVAGNSTGDARLTQFDMPGNTHITLLAATSAHLYVGFNNTANGLVVFRTANPAAKLRSDFRGLLDCPADQASSSCQGLGQNGLGVGATRIFDGSALAFEGKSYLYLTAGTGAGPVRVFRVAD